MAETESTTRPAWLLAGVSILLLGALLLVWSHSASADCLHAEAEADAACPEDSAWGGEA